MGNLLSEDLYLILKKIILSFIFNLLFLYPISSADEVKTKEEEAPVSVVTDHLEQEKDHIVGTGDVDVRYRDLRILGDRIELNRETGYGLAIGNVIMEDKDSRIECSEAEFNINTKLGTMYDAHGYLASDYYFSGRKIERVARDRYRVFSGGFTTCSCSDDSTPAWRFRAKEGDIKIEGYAKLQHPTFFIKDIPLLYLPYMIVPVKTERTTGFLIPSLGRSSKDGFFINNSFFWAINQWSDATFYLDYLEKKGDRPGIEYRYIPNQKTEGQFNGTYLKEKDTEREFWKVRFNHSQEFIYKVKGLARLDLLSDYNPDKEFSDIIEERVRRETDSYISLIKNWENRSLELLTRYREGLEEGPEEGFGQIPQLTFKNQVERIYNTPFFFNMESSYAGLYKKIKESDTKETAYVSRLDIHPQLSFPFTRVSWLMFTPTIGIRETYYDLGERDGEETDGFTREIYDINLLLEGPNFSRVFHTKSEYIPKIKHLIEPRIIYDYIPEMDEDDRRKIIGFDGVDNIPPLSRVTYSLTNRVLKKVMQEESVFKTEEALRLEVSQSYDLMESTRSLIPERRRSPLSEIRFDLDTRIIDPLMINMDSTYDIYDDIVSTVNMELGIKKERIGHIYLERRYKRSTSTFLCGSLGLILPLGLGFQYTLRYDELKGEVIESDYSLEYPSQCWGLSFDLINRKIFINEKPQDETKFLFLLTLKGVGYIGDKRDGGKVHRGF
ncbi:MAG: LPS-assembly protein LptD [Nitrospinae bacterium]|nr:LPS-assembly protein LptD [Nitrospinota bacterium]